MNNVTKAKAKAKARTRKTSKQTKRTRHTRAAERWKEKRNHEKETELTDPPG